MCVFTVNRAHVYDFVLDGGICPAYSSYLWYKPWQEAIIFVSRYETDVTIRMEFKRRQALKRNGSELQWRK